MRRRTFLGWTAGVVAARSGILPDSASGRVKPPSGELLASGRPVDRKTGGSTSLSGRGIVAALALEGERTDLRRGIEAGLAAATGTSGPDAWGRLFGPDDRVAVKLNCLAGPGLSSRPDVVGALVSGIRSAGVPASSIVLFDRTCRELERAGFPIQKDEGAVRCFGTDALKGGGYGGDILEHRSIASFFTRILTDHATVLVNVGVCKDHDLSGVSAGCKNLYGLIHNPNRYHDNQCDPFLADLLAHPAVRPKLRLTVIDAIEAQCQGGPALVPTYAFRPNRILISLDPVAVDRIAWEMIEQERARRGLPTLVEDKREPTWIMEAGRLGLGESDRSRINLREVVG